MPVAGGGGGGTTYDHAQLMTLWESAGGNPSKADMAAAIAQAESGGNPIVTSANPDGGTNVGLWQLDTKGKGSGHTVAQLQNPSTNAALAVSGSSDGTDWSAWETYTTGAYKQFLGGAAGGVQPNTPPPSAAANTNPPTGLAAIGAFFSSLANPHTWIRVMEVLAGVVLIGIGLNSMLKGKPLQIVTSAAGVAGKAVPA